MVTSLRSGDQRIVHGVVALWLLMAEEIKDPKISRKVITPFWKTRKVSSEEPVNAEYYSKLLYQFKGDIERKIVREVIEKCCIFRTMPLLTGLARQWML